MTDTTIPYLRTQTELLTEVKVLVRHSVSTRWSDAEYYSALNGVLYTWAEHVKMPFVYTLSGGWLAHDFDYALPSYIRPPIFPQLLRKVPHDDYVTDSLTSTWQDIPGWELEPDGSGGNVLRLHAPPRTQEARVLFYAPNSRVPTGSLPTTSGEISSTATSVVLGSAVDIDDVGHIKINAEYISYAGVTRAASTTTLLNLVRGLNGSAAATQATASTVTWCVGMDTLGLMRLLFDQWISYLHAYYLQDGGTHETDRHEKSMGYYAQLAMNFWPTYAPVRKRHKLTLNRKSYMLR
jgi:hypothetical protein